MPDTKRPQVPDEGPATKAGRLTVFSVKQTANGSVWVKAGSAWTNRDGSLNVYLDVLPLDGKLHVRPSDTDPR